MCITSVSIWLKWDEKWEWDHLGWWDISSRELFIYLLCRRQSANQLYRDILRIYNTPKITKLETTHQPMRSCSHMTLSFYIDLDLAHPRGSRSCSHVPSDQLCDVPAAAGLHAAEEGPRALHHGRAAAFQHPRVALRRRGTRIKVLGDIHCRSALMYVASSSSRQIEGGAGTKSNFRIALRLKDICLSLAISLA